jgi:hypothetical protein
MQEQQDNACGKDNYENSSAFSNIQQKRKDFGLFKELVPATFTRWCQHRGISY